ncbi:apolipoprotein L6-like [Notamacropus eugenii]|uniref:apolipoprotein L6-like n=1 Tax=Notamacropus eugenii TaxID=9315 RepID=UPI003B68147A
MDDSDKEMQFAVKIFLEDFPKAKLQLEKHIKELLLAANEIYKIDKTTIKKKATSVVVAGILALAGSALATGGASLVLSLGGMGFAVASSVTSISAYVVDRVRESQLHKVEEETKDILVPLSNSVSAVVSSAGQRHRIFNDINLLAFGPAKAKPGLISTTRKTNEHFARPVLAVTENTRISDALSAGGLLLKEIVGIVQDSVHLSDGAMATTAEKLREKAQDLEEKLQKLSKIYQTLLETDTQSRTLKQWRRPIR